MAWSDVLAARSVTGLSPGARHVLLTVATYANDHGRAWASLGTIAADTGYHPASVRRLVDQLEASTEVCVIHRKGKTSIFELRGLRRGVPRASANPTPRLRPRRTTKETDKETRPARAEPAAVVDIYARLPNWTAERLALEAEAGDQLRLWEV